jgi:putative hydrolase of the HAD superfamily
MTQSNSKTVTAVIWDFGGVITSSPFEAFNRYEESHALPQDFIRSINARNPDHNAWAQFERNEITPAEFDALFAAEAAAQGHDVPGRDILACLAGSIRPNMVAVLKGLKTRGYKIACITNNVQSGSGAGMARTETAATEIEAIMALFDHVIESSKVGIRKPDPEIYRMACAAIDVEPTHAVFLDDLGINLKPARQLGMQTIKVLGAEQAIADLEAVLGHPLP